MTEETKLNTAVAKPEPKAQITLNNQGFLVPTDLEQVFRLSAALARAGEMIPEHFRPKRLPDIEGEPNDTWEAARERAASKIMGALMKGMEIGLAPMQSLASIALINGRPTVWGDAIPAVLQRAGHFIDVEITGEGDALTATATLTRKDGRKVVRSFSMADAKQAGLAGKKGPWQEYPKRMLSMRARSWAARDGAADALMGFEVAEEVADFGPDTARDVTPKADQPRRGGGAVYATPAAAKEPEEKTEPEMVEDGEIVDNQTTAAIDEGAPRMDDDAGEPSADAEQRRADYERIFDIVADAPAAKKMYIDELEAMRVEFPEMYEELLARLEGAKP